MCHTKQIKDFTSFYELIEHFDSEEKCVDYLAQVRWSGEPQCPYCDHDRSYELKVKGRQKRWKCAKCRKQYSVRVGTIFEESKLPLRKWFIAIFLVTAHKKGISSHQLARDLKITQKTAWFLIHRIREAFKSNDEEVFSNPVEIDETYVGGKESNKHNNKRTLNTQGRSTKTKTPVLGIYERGGKVYAVPVENTKAATILPIMRAKVEGGTDINTDEWTPYKSLAKDYNHSVVKHSAGEYVKGDAHTNNIECFWSHFKRGIVGVLHQVSDKHIGSYVNEATFRFNTRDLNDGTRFDVALANCEGRLDYKTLTHGKEA